MTAAADEVVIDRNNPWPGLASFDENAHLFFNGRDRESVELRRLVTQEKLTVLFGASGLGKTSLLKAGLFPRIRQEMLPVYIRIDFRDTDSLIHQVKAALETEIHRHGIDAPQMVRGESLWTYLHRSDLEFWTDQNRPVIPLFVFDQFEEVFTLGAKNPAALQQFRKDLANLIENRLPGAFDQSEPAEILPVVSPDSHNYKILLSFREDFLPSVEEWKHDIPSILRNRLRLLPMSFGDALKAVHITAPDIAPEPIAKAIVAFVAKAGGVPSEGQADPEIEPALLSLFCAGLNERRKKKRKARFDEELLKDAGEEILTEYYDGALAGMRTRVKRFIEEQLITERGFRKPCYYDDALSVHGITAEEIGRLVKRRLLRIEPAGGTERIELVHDRLAPIVQQRRDQNRKRTRRATILRIGLAVAGILATVSVAVGMTALYFSARRALDAQAKANELTTKFQNTERLYSAYQNAIVVQLQNAAEDVADELRRQGRKQLAAQLDQASIGDEQVDRLQAAYLAAARDATTSWYQMQNELAHSDHLMLRIASPDNKSSPHFAQPQIVPDLAEPTRLHTTDDELNYQIINSVPQQPLPFPVYPSTEPILRLADVLGSTGQSAMQAIERSGKISFQAVGSTGNVKSPGNQVMVANAMLRDFSPAPGLVKPSFFLNLGDIVYSFGESEYYYDQFYGPYQNYPAPILAVAGNHEGIVVPGSTDNSLESFLRNFCSTSFLHSPDAASAVRTTQIQPGVYFTFEAPFVRIFVLYSNVLEGMGVISGENGKYPYLGKTQLDFLRAAFKRVKSEKYGGALIIAVHHPPYVFSNHNSNSQMLKDIDSVSRETGVWPHAVLSGHSTNYLRFTRKWDGRETPFIVAGTGGHGISRVTGGTAPLRVPLVKPELSNGSDQIVFDNYDDQDFGYLQISADARILSIAFNGVKSVSLDRVTVDLQHYKLTR